MKLIRKPIITLKRDDLAGGTHKIELFNPYEDVFVLHRHSIVKNKLLSKILGFKRRFFGKFYCFQEIVIFQSEVENLIKAIKKYESNRNHDANR